jgi:RimJ/RimL family protein N-acetyltransferase
VWKRVTSWSSSTEPDGLRARRLEARDRDAVLARLREHARENLLLLDLAGQLGRRQPGEARTDLYAAFLAGRLRGVVSSRPSVLLDAGLAPEELEVLLPRLARASTGLIKSAEALVDQLWAHLEAHGRRALLDRREVACAVGSSAARVRDPGPGLTVREASTEDLPALVHAARASLREEGRPDPYETDPDGFRRWVRGRIRRAVLVECDGRIGFVGYADVRRDEGWLLQGVYTWPEMRRRGLGAVGVSALCRQALAAGADHVQLAVVEGNGPAERLYEGLGFEPFARLRTLLYS